jgi:hypothetical protein
MSEAILEQFAALNAVEQATFLRQATAVHEKTVKAGEKKRKPTAEEKAARPKREQPEGTKTWLNFVKAVYAELKAKNPAAKYGEAMQEAKRRRDAGAKK